MSKFKYFFPDSQDFVDPSFDFLKETRNEHRVRQRDDFYPHEVFKREFLFPYDGMLVSKAVVDGLGNGESKYTRAQRQRFYRAKMKSFFRLPENMLSMGDCGAFTYVGQENPPYTVDEIVDFYEDSGFDLGVSLDHIVFGYDNPKKIIIGEELDECIRRQKLTLDNAEKFLKASEDARFTPYGVAHGWNAKSYTESVRALIQMGYKHITMGGMVPLKTPQILEVLKSTHPYLKTDTKVHLLGIARPESFKDFMSFGVTSIDSTTPLQQAFKDKRNNYHVVDGNAYVALRVPQLDGNLTLSRKIKSGEIDQDVARVLERNALSALRAYGKREISTDEALSALVDYEILHSGVDKADKVRNEYWRTLNERPWDDCDCDVCKQIGIEVIIFRGAERNRRRGFHNIQVLYKKLQTTLNMNTALESRLKNDNRI
ncbi:tRNA-guanine transglycosylase DpdA [Shewanella xiamenensis]|uniref:tRNA-guanine transglycosylase DpdA n=1 Tax=Shewanella xiamenensis TaxID=332186 RepID=A0AAE4PX33_9GAMM|nr:tRNA-guanine transglycosylase DpdA [Shewanella xiamenensis]MCT8862410.1 tRNA-guanine transglycosylase [Shewanella xiamenensis]MDH1315019.1 tRNA-guanine transglycosylase DpdA [Shewanella xiamenensis]MDV5390000.1 tRNA-guanine transglycosylase DpdA [Shewanella xiamenensis]